MGLIGWVVLGALALVIVAVSSVAYQLVRQQGRILLRLDALEALSAPPETSSTQGRPRGLPVATQAPPLRLRDVAGSEVGLEDFRGRRVLLVHWDPQCGFCRQIAADLAELQGDLKRRETELVLVSHGDAESNKSLADEHGLRCPILLQRDGETAEAFTTLGTPAAYLLDHRGRIAKALALGADQVSALARGAAGRKAPLARERPLADSRIERDGIPVGSPAPSFELPDLQGGRVSLDDYRGRRVLVVFSDPACAPCDDVAGDLARFYGEHRDDPLDVVIVTRGKPEENRRKAAAHGIRFPVVIQEGWRVSKKYGIFSTPVAFLVDERGVVSRPVARGGPAIMRLAYEALAAREEAPLT